MAVFAANGERAGVGVNGSRFIQHGKFIGIVGWSCTTPGPGKEWRIARTDLDTFLTERTGAKDSSSLASLLQRRLAPPEHLLVMTSNPNEVYQLQAEFLQAGLKAGYPLFICIRHRKHFWWNGVASSF